MVLKLYFSDPEISTKYIKVLLKASIFTMGNFNVYVLHYIKVKTNHTYSWVVFQEMKNYDIPKSQNVYLTSAL